MLNLDLGATYQLRVYARAKDTMWESSDYRSVSFSSTLVVLACGAAPKVPTITFTQPTNGISGTTSSMHGLVTGTCDGGYGSSYSAACGTVADDGSVTSVQYILQRVGGTLGTRCWNGGILWVSNCDYRNADRTGNKWSVPRNFGSLPYLSDGVFTLTIRATDNDGHVTVSSIKYTVTY